MNRIPIMARALECLLYYNASSFKEYKNMSTFSRRIDTVMVNFIRQQNNENVTYNVDI